MAELEIWIQTADKNFLHPINLVQTREYLLSFQSLNSNDMNESPSISCPKCGSHELYVGKKGFSGKKAVGGALLTGGIGLLAGTVGSNRITITCLNCGHVFKPGDSAKPYVPTFRETVQANKRKIELKRELKANAVNTVIPPVKRTPSMKRKRIYVVFAIFSGLAILACITLPDHSPLLFYSGLLVLFIVLIVRQNKRIAIEKLQEQTTQYITTGDDSME
jgi:hypothetical protein